MVKLKWRAIKTVDDLFAISFERVGRVVGAYVKEAEKPSFLRRFNVSTPTSGQQAIFW